MGLLGELKKYVKDALPGGLLNPEVNTQGILDGAALSTTAVPVLGDLLGLGADLHRYKNEPESRTLGNFALSGLGLLPFVPAMTAWHGSPHKFDKFDMSKIGTGEGAQAYGHGLYLAESPKVAQEYANTLGTTIKVDGKPVLQANKATRTGNDAIDLDLMANLGNLKAAERDSLNAIKQLRAYDPNHPGIKEAQRELANVRALRGRVETSYDGNLYKTDIPDEAVARFLDWDKPLSQQAPEVQAAIRKQMPDRSWEIMKDRKGADYMEHYWNTGIGNQRGGIQESQRLQELGIPGIRYLDGGSRSAGQGSSNFVVFDPEMIRIIERNGQATGQQPWKPVEYPLGGLLGP